MTQKARILEMLRDAGERGVRSDTFYQEFLGRGVARIYDLRQDGYEISSEKEGKFTRYRLQTGRGRQVRGAGSGEDRSASPVNLGASPGATGTDNPRRKTQPARLFEPTPTAYDPWENAA